MRTYRLPAWARKDTIEVITPDTTRTDFSGSDDWTNTTVVSTVNGSVQPAGQQAEARANLLSVRVTHQAYTQAVTVNPRKHRIRVGSQQYAIRDAREWPHHTEMLLEIPKGQ